MIAAEVEEEVVGVAGPRRLYLVFTALFEAVEGEGPLAEGKAEEVEVPLEVGKAEEVETAMAEEEPTLPRGSHIHHI